jgi:hypothetical protein
MKKMTRKAGISCFLFFFILFPAVFYFRYAYDYLSLTKYNKSDILVVEGWLPEYALDKVKQEFLQNNYKLILTTGFPYYQGFQMGSGGKMEIMINKKLQVSQDSIYLIMLTLRGTKADGKFAHFILYADTINLGESYSSRYKKKYIYRVKLDAPPKTVSVDFDNDTFTNYNDRNLYFYSVTINGQIFPVSTDQVSYFVRHNGIYYLRQRLSGSLAADAANYLKYIGIPDSLVIPVETKHKIKSKTYTTALDIKGWLNRNIPVKRPSITIFTQSIHARRSYLSYKKAFGDSADIGVISCEDQRISRSNWWKSISGWKAILYETVGCLYVTLFI